MWWLEGATGLGFVTFGLLFAWRNGQLVWERVKHLNDTKEWAESAGRQEDFRKEQEKLWQGLYDEKSKEVADLQAKLDKKAQLPVTKKPTRARNFTDWQARNRHTEEASN